MNNSLDEILDFKKFFLKILANWYLLVISLIVAFVVAFIYNRYSTELFSVKTSIIIKEDNSFPTTDIFYENISTKKESLENKALQIKAYPLIKKTLEDLNFDITYFIEGNIKVTESYQTPIKLICTQSQKLRGLKFKIDIININYNKKINSYWIERSKDINSLKKAVLNQIDDKGMTVYECQKYHKMLDPFQDGLAYKRTGIILSKLQKEIIEGKSVDEATSNAIEMFPELSINN